MLPDEMSTERRFMDKGILRFVAEAYLLLHSVTMFQAEGKVGGARADRVKAGKQTRETPYPGSAPSLGLRPANSRKQTPDKG